MDSVSKERPFRSFTDDEAKLIRAVSDDILESLKRPTTLHDAAVRKLVPFVTNKVRLAVWCNAPESFLQPVVEETNPMEIDVKHHPTGAERIALKDLFDTHRLLGDRSELIDGFLLGRTQHLPLLLRFVRERYGDVVAPLVDALLSQHQINSVAVDPESAADISDVEGNIYLYHALPSFIGSSVAALLSRPRNSNKGLRWSVERILDAGVRVFLRSGQARWSLFQLLSSHRLTTHVALAEALCRQAHQMFTGIEGMTAYDQHTFSKKECEKKIRNAQLGFEDAKVMLSRTNGIPLESIAIESTEGDGETDQENPALHLDAEDTEVFNAANDYLATHAFEARTALLDIIDAKTCRAKMEELRSHAIYEALGAYQRSVIARIYAEVSRFPYGFEDDDADVSYDQSHLASSPVFAAEKRRMNCLTGQWLLMTLAIECGIPYESIGFCSMNRNSHQISGGMHGGLLFSLADGTLQLVDPAGKICLVRFPLAAISHASTQNRLAAFFDSRQETAEYSVSKWIHDPLRIQIDSTLAKTFDLPDDFHLMCPEQAFTARSLFNIGIGYERAEKPKEAESAYEMASVLEPTSGEILARIGALALAREDLECAGRYLLQSVRANPHHAQTWYHIAVYYSQIGELDQALESLKKCEGKKVWGDPDFVISCGSLQAMIIMQQDAQKQLSEIETALKGEGELLT